MNKIIAFIFLLLLVSNIFAVTTPVEIPTITKSVSTGTTYKFTETLSGKLPTGYKVKIDLNNGKGLVAMTCAATTCTLSSNMLPKGVDSASYKVGIYDAKGVLQGTVIEGDYVISDYAKTFLSSYIKISNSGEKIPDSAKLGNGEGDWACTKDIKTGLIWEVKTTDNGLRDMGDTYTNYTVDFQSSKFSSSKYGESSNTDGFIKAVNSKSLCGATNWRLPTEKELVALVVCSDGKYDANGECSNEDTNIKPTINATYFPNTQSDAFWSSTTYVIGDGCVANFDTGKYHSCSYGEHNYTYVRLVH